jgi:hypothetical protein
LITIWRDPNAQPTFDSSYVYSIRAVGGSAGVAINAANGNYSNGNHVQSWRYVRSNKIGLKDNGNGTYTLYFVENPTKCVDNPGGQTASGVNLQVWDCINGDVWQQWTISANSFTGAAMFKNVGSGKCFDDSGYLAAGATPVIRDCDQSNTHQQWRMTGGYWKPGTSTLLLIYDAYVLLADDGQNNLALDSGSNYANGALLHLASAPDTDINDQMHILPGTAPNTFIIKFVGGNSNKCLDNPGGQTANGTKLQVWDCDGGTAQNWYISMLPSFGGLQFKNQYSGRCLDSTGFNGTEARANGTQMQVYDCNSSSPAQNWQVTVN